jgi:hypothetical protein
MIPRYSRPEMVAIWSPETKFRIWFEIEAHACDALAELGVIPKSAAETIWEKGGKATFDVDRIDEIEAVTKHDVIAFLTHLSEIVGPDARFVHQGCRQAAGSAEAPRLRTQGHGNHRPLARHPCRADHLRHQDGACLCRIPALPGAAGSCPRRSRHLRHLGRGRHLCQH